MSYKWLDWAKRIQSVSQAGLAFSKDKYDIERYKELQTVSAEIMAEYTDLEAEKIIGLFNKESGYQTPKIDVRGAVFRNNKILLVHEKMDNKWSLPGGFCEVGLSPAENIIKEVKEEAGFDVNAARLLALLDMNKHPHPPQPYHYYKIFILCELAGGKAAAGLETKNVKFFREDKLPDLSQARNTEGQISMLFDFLKKPEKQTIVD
ncbi:NUDIX hydrolase [Salipaludibacillus sp. CUR1]|uniref:NUDIX hydrolase n=1 Tax=Salipaludibacillus sp. CUR1 TaxID=2820003 RepID=UPI001E3D0437|nr:NUDIX hydrolase [Salipaludibacillus sp. CUR1]MCE7791231.1 NUDIX hydrolase [Salipaludibacillus sp. CUR1]